MEDTIQKVKVNQGLNIRRMRTALQIKQEAFAQKLGISQQTFSKYENMEVLEDDFIDKCAKILNVPADVIKNTPEYEGTPRQIFKDVKFTATNSKNPIFAATDNHITNHFCDDEVVEMIKDNMRLLKVENEKLKSENEMLKKQLEAKGK